MKIWMQKYGYKNLKKCSKEDKSSRNWQAVKNQTSI
jgi:hypothetical protein